MFDKFTALYVEDEEQIKNIVSTVLGAMFKNFYVASNGQEGLDFFRNHQDEINIIITDINMPLMNGLEMCQKIRELDINIPIIITTAHNDKDFLHKAIDVGVSSFVVKPMDIEKLVEAINKSMEPVILQQKLEEEIRQHHEERVMTAKFSAIGQLSAGITHEINTPLTYIKASFEMMEYALEDISDSKLKQNMQKDIDRINDGILRIENIIGSMKEMSQQSKMENEECNIYSTLITASILAYNKAKHISKTYINGSEFNLDMSKEDNNYTAIIQKQRVEQVWIIIINNAMDELMKIPEFNDRRLDINISEDEDNVYVIFKDNAGGIKPEIIEDIFEPFKGTKESSGMGVGLSIAKNIIDQQNGTIEAYNEDNGAVFKITLKKSFDDKNIDVEF